MYVKTNDINVFDDFIRSQTLGIYISMKIVRGIVSLLQNTDCTSKQYKTTPRKNT